MNDNDNDNDRLLYFLQVDDRFDETHHNREPVGVRSLRVEIDGVGELTRTWNVDGKPRHPPGLGWHLAEELADHSTWRRRHIPRRPEAEIETEAREVWGGSRDKVWTAATNGVWVDDVMITSRYGQYEELRLMATVVEEMPASDRAMVGGVDVDSKSNAICVSVTAGGRADWERIADWLDSEITNSTRVQGHGGVLVGGVTVRGHYDAGWRA
jgi:hypothetical protein